MRVLLVVVGHLGQEAVVGALGEPRLLVQQLQNARRRRLPRRNVRVSESRKEKKNEKERRAYAFDEVETPLVVVEGDGVPILETLRFVFLLLEHEDVVVEVLLERLVGEVDAQLLEAVFLLLAAGTVRSTVNENANVRGEAYGEVLESKDVQDADERALLGEGALDGVVDLLHQPTEQPVVEGLGQRVASVRGLVGTPMSVSTQAIAHNRNRMGERAHLVQCEWFDQLL